MEALYYIFRLLNGKVNSLLFKGGESKTLLINQAGRLSFIKFKHRLRVKFSLPGANAVEDSALEFIHTHTHTSRLLNCFCNGSSLASPTGNLAHTDGNEANHYKNKQR